MRRLAGYILGSATENNRYIVGAYALGATPDETAAAAAATWQAQQKPAASKPATQDSGVSVGSIAFVAAILVGGLVAWPRVSRWLG